MTKKKFALCTTAMIALMAGTSATFSIVKTDKVAAAGENVKTIFSDDFSTYNSYDEMGLNWSNYYFDQADTVAQYGAGTERVGWASNKWASVVQDPANPSNKVLDIDTEETLGVGAGGNSYFYITPSKDGEPLLLKNYTISFKYKIKNTCAGANTVTAPWIATLNRKKNLDANGDYQPYDGSFIDASNAFMSLRAGTRTQDASGTSPYYFSEALLWDIGRDPMPVGTETNTVATNNVYGDWITYKCVVFENTFTLYLNDTLMTQFTVPTYDSQAKNLDAGYVSIACCVLDAYLDDVTITTTPDHPEITGQTEVVREKGVALPVVYDLETYGEAITGVDVRRKGEKTVLLDSSAYTYENGLFRLDANYVSLLPTGETEFVIHTAKGSVNVVVNVADSNPLQSTPISLTATKGSDKNVALSGVTAVYGVSRGDKAVLPATAWSFANGTLTLTKDYINYLVSDNDLPLIVYTDAGYYTIRLTIVDAKTISVEKNIAAAGSVTGGGVYEDGTKITLIATTNEGYNFLGWYDGNTLLTTNETYQVTVSADKTYTAKWKKITYVITVANDNTTAGTVSGGGEFAENETVTLTAIPNEGYEFVGWWEGNAQIPSAYATYSFEATANRTIEAKWKIKTYTITINKNIDEAGRAFGGGGYMHDQKVTLSVDTNAGYTFDGWYDGETQLSPKIGYTFTAKEDRTITAKWTKNTYIVTVIVSDGGTVTGAGSYEHGESVTLTPNANTGYRFSGWFSNGVQMVVSTIYTFTVTENVTIEARFGVYPYPITATSEDTVKGTVIGGGSYGTNESATLTATANEGYTFEGWYEGDTKVSSDATYSFTVIEARTLVAKFTKNTYTIGVDKNVAKAGSVTGAGVYEYGASVELKATTNAGYTFDGWYEGSSKVSSNETYTFTATSNRTLVAKWTKNTYTVAVNKNIDVAGSVTGAGSYEYGTSVELKATTNAGYTFDGWYEGSSKVSSNETYTFTATSNRTLVAKWTKNTYTITVNKNIDVAGSVTGGGVYDEGASVELNATTNAGYAFLGWYDGNTLLSANAQYQITVSANKTYTAKWEEVVIPSVPTYTITINRNIEAAGETTDSGTFDEGETITLMATTNAGYRFLGWYDGETLLSTNAKYKVVVSADKTYTAKWEEIVTPSVPTYTITVKGNIDAAGDVMGAGVYDEGATVTLIAMTNAGYQFLGWYDGETLLSTNAKCQVTASADKTYTAKWEKVTVASVGCSSTAGTLPLFITAGALVCGMIALKKRKDEDQ